MTSNSTDRDFDQIVARLEFAPTSFAGVNSRLRCPVWCARHDVDTDNGWQADVGTLLRNHRSAEGKAWSVSWSENVAADGTYRDSGDPEVMFDLHSITTAGDCRAVVRELEQLADALELEEVGTGAIIVRHQLMREGLLLQEIFDAADAEEIDPWALMVELVRVYPHI